MFHHYLLKKLFFLIELYWYPCQNLSKYKYMGLYSKFHFYSINLYVTGYARTDYCSSVVSFEIGNCESSNFVFMVFIASLNIFIIADLNSLSSMSNILASTGT